MKGKALGVLICMLMITAALPIVSSSVIQTEKIEISQNYDFVPGELLVRFSENTKISDSSISGLNDKYQVKSIEKIFKNKDDSILGNIYKISVSEDADILSIAKEYSLNPDVVYAEPNYLLRLTFTPDDEFFSNQWHLHQDTDADIDAPEAWEIEKGSTDVTIAIIDTGVDYTHPDLEDNIWINTNEIADNGIDDDNNGFIDDNIGWDFVGNSITNPQPDNDPIDDLGHGTHCAGLATAVTNNGIGVAGVCWNAKIMCLRVGGGSIGLVNLESALEAIIYAADNGAQVISMSFGGYDYTNAMKDTVNDAYQSGAVLVGGAGNLPFKRKFYPAGFDNVIAVSATNKNDERAWFSAWGNWVDVAAPGEYVYSTMPSYHVALNDLGFSMNYEYLDGTSMSTPIVSGLAGLILSNDPSLNPDEVKNIIRDSSEWIITDKVIGRGRINAYNAMLITAGYTNPPAIPTVDGPLSGSPGTTYTYTIDGGVDPDGDDMFYLVYWGDGTYSDWIGPYPSGQPVTISNTWSNKGKYYVKVKAMDDYGIESDWSDPIVVTMPRKRVIYNLFFEIIEDFQIFKLLINLL